MFLDFGFSLPSVVLLRVSRKTFAESGLDSIAVSVFADIFIELTITVSDNKIQITILIL